MYFANLVRRKHL